MKTINQTWITPELQQELHLVFEPRYHRKLLKEEIIEIANNLTVGIENILKLKVSKQYGK